MKRILLFLFLLPGYLFAQNDSLQVLQSDVSLGEPQEASTPALTWKDRREPFMAGFLSYMMPGLGQVYNKQYEKAFGVAAVVASSLVMGDRFARMGNEEAAGAVFSIGIGSAWLYSFIDAITTASKINKSIQLSNHSSMSLKPVLQFHGKPFLPSDFKPEPLLGLKLSVSL